MEDISLSDPEAISPDLPELRLIAQLGGIAPARLGGRCRADLGVAANLRVGVLGAGYLMAVDQPAIGLVSPAGNDRASR